jgi:hypothetical protein
MDGKEGNKAVETFGTMYGITHHGAPDQHLVMREGDSGLLPLQNRPVAVAGPGVYVFPIHLLSLTSLLVDPCKTSTNCITSCPRSSPAWSM